MTYLIVVLLAHYVLLSSDWSYCFSFVIRHVTFITSCCLHFLFLRSPLPLYVFRFRVQCLGCSVQGAVFRCSVYGEVFRVHFLGCSVWGAVLRVQCLGCSYIDHVQMPIQKETSSNDAFVQQPFFGFQNFELFCETFVTASETFFYIYYISQYLPVNCGFIAIVCFSSNSMLIRLCTSVPPSFSFSLMSATFAQYLYLKEFSVLPMYSSVLSVVTTVAL